MEYIFQSQDQSQSVDYLDIGEEYFLQSLDSIESGVEHDESMSANYAKSSCSQSQCHLQYDFDLAIESFLQSLPESHSEYPCAPESMSHLEFSLSPATMSSVNEQVLGCNIGNLTSYSSQQQRDEPIEFATISTPLTGPTSKTYTYVWDSTYMSRSVDAEMASSPISTFLDTSTHMSSTPTSSVSMTPVSSSVVFDIDDYNSDTASASSWLRGDLAYPHGSQLFDHSEVQMLTSPFRSAPQNEMSADIPTVMSQMHEASAFQFDFLQIPSGDSVISKQSNINDLDFHTQCLSPPPPPPLSRQIAQSLPTPSPPPPSLPSVVLEHTCYQDWEPDPYDPNGPKKIAAKDFPLHIQNQVLSLAKLNLIRDMFKVHSFLDQKGGPGISSAEVVLLEAAEQSRLFTKLKQKQFFARYKANMTKIVWESRKDVFTTGKAIVTRNVIEFLELTRADPSQVQRRTRSLADLIKVDNDDMLYELGIAKFSHQIVGVVIHQLFYGDTDKVGRRFYDLYGFSVRITMVAFVLCLLDHVLSEYQTGRYIEKKDINIVQFRALYDIILGQLKKLDANRLRQEQFRTWLKNWAAEFSNSVWDAKKRIFIPVRATV